MAPSPGAWREHVPLAGKRAGPYLGPVSPLGRALFTPHLDSSSKTETRQEKDSVSQGLRFNVFLSAPDLGYAPSSPPACAPNGPSLPVTTAQISAQHGDRRNRATISSVRQLGGRAR
ncbi:hypothetical protein AAFF_G00359140 [Aldrovandia affinis]|uniref:Uncharacterized protein n=1 Tax=Aldrovandia affinis TaxID=143900 RepID=A0AAD7SI67_9TELE|nr:hypothetical protein AAFF_G00359140 [Aldrovandia affinis]